VGHIRSRNGHAACIVQYAPAPTDTANRTKRPEDLHALEPTSTINTKTISDFGRVLDEQGVEYRKPKSDSED
jgi:hypothetical protein